MVKQIRAWATTDGQIFPTKEEAEKVQSKIDMVHVHKDFGKITFKEFLEAVDKHKEEIASYIKVVRRKKSEL